MSSPWQGWEHDHVVSHTNVESLAQVLQEVKKVVNVQGCARTLGKTVSPNQM